MGNKKGDRFEEIYSEGTMSTTKVLRDKETGVCYLVVTEGYGCAMTPLLNSVGNVTITGLAERR